MCTVFLFILLIHVLLSYRDLKETVDQLDPRYAISKQTVILCTKLQVTPGLILLYFFSYSSSKAREYVV